LFDLQFDAVELEEHHIVASGSQAQALAMRLGVQRDFLLAADAVGGAAALLQMTVDYLQARTQFGRPLALFQALKHRCADLKAQTEAAEALATRQSRASTDEIAPTVSRLRNSPARPRSSWPVPRLRPLRRKRCNCTGASA
jgi:alkylation response protein AidB-like acyl-CoA dehydrogenase